MGDEEAVTRAPRWIRDLQSRGPTSLLHPDLLSQEEKNSKSFLPPLPKKGRDLRSGPALERRQGMRKSKSLHDCRRQGARLFSLSLTHKHYPWMLA